MTMEVRDLFSEQAAFYAEFRPVYPDELYHFIFGHVQHFDTAWDCGTGNGQVAGKLAQHFAKVYATDTSEKQLSYAEPASNIQYSIGSAEHPAFPDHTFDLITVGQALHWFDTQQFFKQVHRVCKPGGLVAIWGYGNLEINDRINPLLRHFYYDVVGPYWNPARRMVEDEYASVHFPFDMIDEPRFYIRVDWTIEQLAGYLTSWSSTQAYIRKTGQNPVPHVVHQIRSVWGTAKKHAVQFPIFLKLGRVA